MTVVEEILSMLYSIADPSRLKYMKRYGINTENALGISNLELRKIAKQYHNNHVLALALWDTGVHEARMLACFVDDASKVTSDQMDTWTSDFNSWDICDQACTSLFDRNPLAWKKVFYWSKSEEEFVRRAAFSLIAGLCIHDKKASNKCFEQFFPLIKTYAVDNRKYVKKAVNWALRNIGKRNTVLHRIALECSVELVECDFSSAKWIGRNAFKELQSDKVKRRMARKSQEK